MNKKEEHEFINEQTDLNVIQKQIQNMSQNTTKNINFSPKIPENKCQNIISSTGLISEKFVVNKCASTSQSKLDKQKTYIAANDYSQNNNFILESNQTKKKKRYSDERKILKNKSYPCKFDTSNYFYYYKNENNYVFSIFPFARENSQNNRNFYISNNEINKYENGNNTNNNMIINYGPYQCIDEKTLRKMISQNQNKLCDNEIECGLGNNLSINNNNLINNSNNFEYIHENNNTNISLYNNAINNNNLINNCNNPNVNENSNMKIANESCSLNNNIYDNDEDTNIINENQNSYQEFPSIDHDHEHEQEKTKSKFKENYLDLLIEAADKLLTTGIKLDNINSPKFKKKSSSKKLKNIKNFRKKIKSSKSPTLSLNRISSNTNNNPHTNNSRKSSLIDNTDPQQSQRNKSQSSNNNNSQINMIMMKCQNKICPVILNRKSDVHQVKMTLISQNKNHQISNSMLCTSCYQAFKNGQYCHYCGVVYRHYKGKAGFNEHKTWIGCDFCNNWEHVQCEEQKGEITNLSSLIRKDNKYQYKCPICRIKENKDKKYNNSSNNPNSNNEYTNSRKCFSVGSIENTFGNVCNNNSCNNEKKEIINLEKNLSNNYYGGEANMEKKFLGNKRGKYKNNKKLNGHCNNRKEKENENKIDNTLSNRNSTGNYINKNKDNKDKIKNGSTVSKRKGSSVSENFNKKELMEDIEYLNKIDEKYNTINHY